MDSTYLCFFDASLKLEMSLWAAAESAVVEACGLKLGSVGALRSIAALGDSARVQDLAVDLGITIGAVSKLVDRLEAADLVRRQPHESDGRSHVIGRTRKGISTLDRALTAMDAALQAHLGDRETDVALRGLAKRLDRLATG